MARVACLRAVVLALVWRLERAPVERELDERAAVERELADRLAVDRVLPLGPEEVDERFVLLGLDALVLRRPPLEPDPPLLACGICSSLVDEVFEFAPTLLLP